jgi:hypothetical protein
MEYIVVLVTAYFRYQRPEGALAGGSRKSDSISDSLGAYSQRVSRLFSCRTRLQVKLTEPPKKLRKWKKRTKKRQFVVSIANRAVP